MQSCIHFATSAFEASFPFVSACNLLQPWAEQVLTRSLPNHVLCPGLEHLFNHTVVTAVSCMWMEKSCVLYSVCLCCHLFMSVYIIYADICCLHPPVLLEQSGQPPNSYKHRVCLHRTYCTAAITPNLHLWSMSRLVSFGLWKVQQFAKIQDLGLELAVSHCRHCNILSRHLCNIRFVFLSYTHPPKKNKNADSENMSSIWLRKAPALGLSPTQTLTHTYWMEFWVGWCQYVALPHAKCVKQASSCQRSWLLEFQLDFSDAGKQRHETSLGKHACQSINIYSVSTNQHVEVDDQVVKVISLDILYKPQ